MIGLEIYESLKTALFELQYFRQLEVYDWKIWDRKHLRTRLFSQARFPRCANIDAYGNDRPLSEFFVIISKIVPLQQNRLESVVRLFIKK